MAWLRVDTQTILTIQNQVITKNHRISVANTEKKIWQLRIRDVKETDKGWYMCQINTDPMKSQMGYLNVVGEIDFYWLRSVSIVSSFLCSFPRYFRRTIKPRFDCPRIRKRDSYMSGFRFTRFELMKLKWKVTSHFQSIFRAHHLLETRTSIKNLEYRQQRL